MPAWRAAMRIALRELWRSKGRTILVLVCVAMPVLVATAIDVGVRSTPVNQIGNYDAMFGSRGQAIALVSAPGSVVVQSTDGSGYGTKSGLDYSLPRRSFDEMTAQLAKVLPPHAELLEQISGTARLSAGADNTLWSTPVAVVDATKYPATELYPVSSGRPPTASGEIAITAAQAEVLGVSLGESVDIRSTTPDASDDVSSTATIVGIQPDTAASVIAFPGTLPALSNSEQLASWIDRSGSNLAAQWFVTGTEGVSWQEVLAANDLGIVVVSREVLAAPPPRDQVPYESDQAGGGPDVNGTTVALLGVIVLLGLLEAVLMIGPAFAIGVQRSRRTLGLVAAGGGRPRDLRRIVVGQGLFLGVFAAAIGSGLGCALAAVIVGIARLRDGSGGLPLVFAPIDLALFAAAGVVIAVVASWIPSRVAARTDPLMVLRSSRADAAPRGKLARWGLAGVLAGLVMVVWGGASANTLIIVSGALVLELGIIASASLLVAWIGKAARRLPVLWRLAFRDASRHRSRTIPALVAVIGAVAAACAGGIYAVSAASDPYHHQEEVLAPEAVTMPIGDALKGNEAKEAISFAEERARLSLPGIDLVPATFLVAPESIDDGSYTMFGPELVYSQECPVDDPNGSSSSEDPQCAVRNSYVGIFGVPVQSVLVDDGAVTRASGVSTADAAADVLSQGVAVVSYPRYLQSDGTVHMTLSSTDVDGNTVQGTVAVPARYVGELPLSQDVIVPPSLVASLQHIELGSGERVELPEKLAGFIVNAGRPLTGVELVQGQNIASMFSPNAGFSEIDLGPGNTATITLAIIMAAALILVLGVVLGSTSMIAVESIPDVRTLESVGATPRMRRQFFGAQAGVLSIGGVVVGVLLGILTGWALTRGLQTIVSPWSQPTPVHFPWWAIAAMAIGIPVLTVGCAALFVRPKVTLTHRAR